MTTSYGRYQVVQELPPGAMARVFIAFDPSFDRHVVVKVLPYNLMLQDPRFLERFRREAQVLGRLHHDAVVSIFDYGEEGNEPFIVMEYMTGGSLRNRIPRTGMGATDALAILERVAAAVDAAHQAGIVHRDLKPDNVLFDDRARAFVTDFGIAKIVDTDGAVTMGRTVIGTPAYMSPEQALGQPVSSATDIYAFGVLAYEMLTGRQPFEGTYFDVLRKHVEAMPNPPSVYRPDLAALDAPIMACIAKDPAQRPRTAVEAAGWMKATQRQGTALPPPVPPPQQPSPSAYGSPPPSQYGTPPPGQYTGATQYVPSTQQPQRPAGMPPAVPPPGAYTGATQYVPSTQQPARPTPLPGSPPPGTPPVYQPSGFSSMPPAPAKGRGGDPGGKGKGRLAMLGIAAAVALGIGGVVAAAFLSGGDDDSSGIPDIDSLPHAHAHR